MIRFSATAEAIAATSSKLEKRRLLAEYLASLDDSDLFWAVTYFSGLTFPRASGRLLRYSKPRLRTMRATRMSSSGR